MRVFIVLCLVTVACADSGLSFNPVTDAGLLYDASAPVAESTLSSPYSSPAELDKEFYSFSAPEGEFEDANAVQHALGTMKQGIRVVFIKGPENKAFEDAALALAKQSAQQQTAIYVLNRQTNIVDLANKLNAAGRNTNSKPEVHFVKYRTNEDAANAQRAIQSEYDSLAGNSHTINGGVAPVINFASQATVRTATSQQPQNAYLPSSVFRLRL